MDDFLVVEASSNPGGLASSFIDDSGFTWDIGGHVQFSHYDDFDRVMDLALPNQWLQHQRESWVWIMDRFVPYPFQNNLWRLPEEIQKKCISKLEDLHCLEPKNLPTNFKEWILQSFGEGIAEVFMLPYNFKVWAHPLEKMSYQWIGERVATVDLEKVKQNIKNKKDELSWGPNSTFRFPLKGGTGAIWNSVAAFIKQDKLRLKAKVIKIDKVNSIATLSSGEEIQYKYLLSTIPLTNLASLAEIELSGALLSSDSHIIGIGLEGVIPDFLKTKCWMYFPEKDVPFYRVTVFSNYSPNNVPDSRKHWSLMAEISSSPFKIENEKQILEDTISGLRKIKFISSSDNIISHWQYRASPGYPTPSIDRDKIVHHAFDQLKEFNIFSRGRFGAWKYEVSNQDHTFMQGFEWADWYMKKTPEFTVFNPNEVNTTGKRPLRSL